MLKGAALGIARVDKPRCIYWYGSGYGDYHVEWLDAAPIEKRPRLIHELESFEAQAMAKAEPEVDYSDFIAAGTSSPE